MPKRISYPARIRPGSDTYYIRVGNSRPVSSGTSNYEEACELQAKETAKHYRRVKLGEKPPKSWKEAVVRWCQEKQHKPTLHEDRQKLSWFDPHLGHIEDINWIDRDMMHEIMSTYYENLSLTEPARQNVTANKYVAVVSWILNAASRDWGWGNIVPRFRTYPTEEVEQRWLTPEEWRLLEAVLPPHTRRLATFSLATGVRAAKALGLKWTEVDLKNRWLNVKGTGKKLGVSAPLNNTAMNVLLECRSLPIVSSEYVFLLRDHPQTEIGNVIWHKYCERAGIRYAKWHSLRHTFTSWLAQNDVPWDIQERLVGHKIKGAHARYVHHDENLRKYSAVIDRVLAGQVSKERAG